MFFFFFFNDASTTDIYTLSLHDALPIWRVAHAAVQRADEEHPRRHAGRGEDSRVVARARGELRSEEHTSELQSHSDLVCRLLLEKKKTKKSGEGSQPHVGSLSSPL